MIKTNSVNIIYVRVNSLMKKLGERGCNTLSFTIALIAIHLTTTNSSPLLYEKNEIE